MVPCRGSLLLVFAFSASLVRAQTFDLEQFEQIFRPRLRLEGRYMPETAFRDTSGHFGSTDGTAVITFPIRSHFDVGMKLDTSARGLGDLLKKSIRVQASQVLGNVRLGARQVELGFDSAATRNLYSASLGMLGVKLTRTYRVLFWSANVNVSEEDATFDRAALRCNAVIGQLHVNGLRRQFFYGLALSYADRLTLPVPFLGGTAPLGKEWSFQYLLPVQLAVGFRPHARTRFLAGVGFDAFRSGIQWPGEDRSNMDHAALRAFLQVRHKAGAHVQIRGEAAYALAHAVRFGDADVDPTRYPVQPGLVVGVGVNIFFGGSVLERVMDEVLR